MESAPAYLARRLRAQHGISDRATAPQLEAICAARGIVVRRVPSLRCLGLYLPDGVVILAAAAPPAVLAHELYHALVHDNARHGVIYAYTGHEDPALEADCEQFAALLCGDPGEGPPE